MDTVSPFPFAELLDHVNNSSDKLKKLTQEAKKKGYKLEPPPPAPIQSSVSNKIESPRFVVRYFWYVVSVLKYKII